MQCLLQYATSRAHLLGSVSHTHKVDNLVKEERTRALRYENCVVHVPCSFTAQAILCEFSRNQSSGVFQTHASISELIVLRRADKAFSAYDV